MCTPSDGWCKVGRVYSSVSFVLLTAWYRLQECHQTAGQLSLLGQISGFQQSHCDPKHLGLPKRPGREEHLSGNSSQSAAKSKQRVKQDWQDIAAPKTASGGRLDAKGSYVSSC